MRIRKRRALAVFVFYGGLLFLGITWISSSAAGGARPGTTPRGVVVRGNPAAGGGAGGGAPARVPARAGAATNPATPTTAAGDAANLFETKIRPVLVKECYGCHASDVKDPGGSLVINTRQGIRRGGDRGPGVVPGNVEASTVIKALRYSDKDLQMPPKGKLADSVLKDFETWVKLGAPDTRDGSAPLVKTYDTEKAKQWWAFQTLKPPAPAAVADTAWPRNDIDRYVLAGLEAKSIRPVADADKLTLIRRVSFDLVGLPPTPEEVDAFVNDSAKNAFDKVVDKLLASPRFGERWGRHWLDVARYAESTGKDVNMTFPEAWRYRDYVIASFNNDKPYDQFVHEQVAGDLMPWKTPQARAEQEIATGFLALGPKGLDERESRQFALDLADEQVATVSQAFMGLTVACARCHDHKFDPITQRDYYGMAGIFLSTKTHFGTLPGPRSNQSSDLIELPAAASQPTVRNNLAPQDRAKLIQDIAAATKSLTDLIATRGTPSAPQNLANQIQQALGLQAHLQNQLNQYDASGKPIAFCMGAEDRPPTLGKAQPMGPPAARRGPLQIVASGFETIADSPLFFRGEAAEPRDRVPRSVPVFLASTGMGYISQSQSGRKELSTWLTSPKNPLTARVMANRIWFWLEGQGIVASVDNFGTMGEPPSNQPLLDYLANRLVDNRWSIKKTIREIVLSRTYQLASTYNEDALAADSQNGLCWRHTPVRLEAESLRDAILATSGQLNLTPPVGSQVALMGNGGIAAGPAYSRISDIPFINAAGVFRSIYLPALRDVEPDSMAVFDYPDTNAVNGAREVTNVPSQALFLLNSDVIHNQARLMGRRIMTAFPGGINQPRIREARVNLAFQLAFGRPANANEQKLAADFFATLVNDSGIVPIEAWADFCQSLYNTAEFRYLR